MSRWLLGKDQPITEPNVILLSAAEVRCTPGGQVMHLEGARSTYDLNRDLEKELAAGRRRLWSTTDRANLLDQVRRIAGVHALAQLPEPHVEQRETVARDGYEVHQFLLTQEEGLYLPSLVFHPDQDSGGNAVLYLHEGGKQADAAPGGPMEKLARTGRMVAAVDLRGLGETQAKAGWGDELFGPDTKGVLAAYLLGRSYVAMRSEDILVCARLLGDRTGRPVDLIAVGHVCVPTLHAAALEPQLFGSVRLVRGLTSWASVIESGRSRNQLVNIVHGALGVYDLPDLARILGDRLTIEQPLNALGEP
jgi:hypothetical protein